MSTVVTIRVTTELKKDMERYRVEAGAVARRAFEDEVRRKRLEEAKTASQAFQEIFRGVSEAQIVESIREDRERR